MLFYFQADITSTHLVSAASWFLAVMRFGSSLMSYLSWITILSALMPVKPKAASCRQYHRGHFDSNRIGHSSVHLFRGDFAWSKNCCTVHEHFHSAHLQTISWIELSAQINAFLCGFHSSASQTWRNDGARLLTSFSTNSFSSSLLIFTRSPPSSLQNSWAWY